MQNFIRLISPSKKIIGTYVLFCILQEATPLIPFESNNIFILRSEVNSPQDLQNWLKFKGKLYF